MPRSDPSWIRVGSELRRRATWPKWCDSLRYPPPPIRPIRKIRGSGESVASERGEGGAAHRGDHQHTAPPPLRGKLGSVGTEIDQTGKNDGVSRSLPIGSGRIEVASTRIRLVPPEIQHRPAWRSPPDGISRCYPRYQPLLPKVSAAVTQGIGRELPTLSRCYPRRQPRVTHGPSPHWGRNGKRAQTPTMSDTFEVHHSISHP